MYEVNHIKLSIYTVNVYCLYDFTYYEFCLLLYIYLFFCLFYSWHWQFLDVLLPDVNERQCG